MMTQTFYPYEPRELIHPDCPNFFMYEIFKSETADRLDIDNTQGFDHELRKHAAVIVSELLQPIRDHYGKTLKISSWYRCEDLEKVICQKSFQAFQQLDYLNNSWEEYFKRKSHPKGEAVDFEIFGIDNDELFAHISRRGRFIYDQLIREYRRPGDPQSGWVHVSRDISDTNRFEVLHRP